MKKQLLYLFVVSCSLLGLVGSIWFVFKPVSNPNTGQETMVKAETEIPEDAYQVTTLYAQDPISIDGTAQLEYDRAYFYNPELGEIANVNVQDGQMVKRGDVLYRYYQGGDLEDQIEDAKREQTRLYDQRVNLIDQLSTATGLIYNYRGDRLEGYWGNDGEYYYYVAEEIGKGGQSQTSQLTESQYDSVDSGDVATTEYQFKEQIRQLNNQIEDVEIRLIRLQEKQHGKVTADFDGKAYVNSIGKTDSSQPLVRLVSDKVLVKGSVSEYEFYLLEKDRPAQLYVKAEDRYMQGTMVDYDELPPIQAPSSTEQAGGNLPGPSFGNSGTQYNFTIQPEEEIQPGFSVTVQLSLPGYPVPQETIVEEDGAYFVYVHQEGTAVKKRVQLEMQSGQQVIMGDLQPGDQLIIMPGGLTDGQSINVIDPYQDMLEDPAMEDIKG